VPTWKVTSKCSCQVLTFISMNRLRCGTAASGVDRVDGDESDEDNAIVVEAGQEKVKLQKGLEVDTDEVVQGKGTLLLWIKIYRRT